MNMYEIKNETVALMSDGSETSVVELNQELIISCTPLAIMKQSCSYYGSSFDGRVKGSSALLGLTYKVPVLVLEDCVFFPTKSYRDKTCCWFSLNYLDHYLKKGDQVVAYFTNGIEILVPISYSVFHKQVLEATRLKFIYQKRAQNL